MANKSPKHWHWLNFEGGPKARRTVIDLYDSSNAPPLVRVHGGEGHWDTSGAYVLDYFNPDESVITYTWR